MRHALIFCVLMSAAAAVPVADPLAAQTLPIDQRVNKLEKEMKAVQRKVFPAGVPVQPEIGPVDRAPEAAPTTPTTTPLADLTDRVDALESQLRNLIGQVEMDGNRLRRLEDSVKALDGRIETRLRALEPQPEPTAADAVPALSAATPPSVPQTTRAPAPQAVAVEMPPAPRPATQRPSQPVVVPLPTTPSRAQAATPAPASAAPANAAQRKALVEAVEVPATGDAIEDAYSYGFRLWQAKLYPEAQAKLKDFVAKNPRHRRASYAQNLLGRAYLDEGKPALASVAFYENYTRNPKGERAAESLFYLGVSLTRLKKLPDACKVYDEFNEVYGATATADLKTRVARGRVDAKCS